MIPLRNVTVSYMKSLYLYTGSLFTSQNIQDSPISVDDLNKFDKEMNEYSLSFYANSRRRSRMSPPKRRISSCLSDGKPGKFVEYRFGTVISFSELGYDTVDSRSAVMDQIRFVSYDPPKLVSMNFFLDPVTDNLGRGNKSAKEARDILKKISAVSDIKSFETVFRKFSQNRRYSW